MPKLLAYFIFFKTLELHYEKKKHLDIYDVITGGWHCDCEAKKTNCATNAGC